MHDDDATIIPLLDVDAVAAGPSISIFPLIGDLLSR